MSAGRPFSPSPTETLAMADYVRDFRQAAQQATDWIAGYLENARRYPVVPPIQPGYLVDALPHSAPEQGEPFDAILADFEKLVVPAVTHWNHPRFMAYFACTGSSPAVIGEMLAAALNTNGLHWRTSPAVAELEQVTLSWLRQWLELPEEFFGIIYDTASVSSLHALIAAREMAAPEAREEGSPAGLVAYASEQSHSSIDKAAIAIGVGHKNLRKVPVDAEFRLRPDLLEAAIQQDLRAGKRPFCIVATAGTTSTTSVDPLAAMAELAEKYKLWLHVDAAYAGSAAILPELRPLFAGMERAHSVVLNPHKWMFTPVDLSAFYTRRPDILRRALSLVPEYLRPATDPRAVNLMDYGVPLGRRFRALKFWFVLRYFGREGIQRALRAHIAWAKRLAAMIEGDARFEVVAPVPFSVVCFRYRGSDEENRAILERVNSGGKLYISHTELGGRVVLRVAIGNLGTTWDDVAQGWEIIRAAVPA